MKFTAAFQTVSERRIALVEELAVANTQGDTLDEARENLTEALEPVLELNRVLAEESHLGNGVIREPLTPSVGSDSPHCRTGSWSMVWMARSWR